MEFGNTKNSLYFLILVFITIIFYIGYKKRKVILQRINYPLNSRQKKMRYLIMAAGILLIVFSLLDPQVLQGYIKVERRALDIYALVDVSKSMMTDDIKPTRLDRVKESIGTLIDNLKGDRIGFIPFASDAYIQMPLTDDYDVAKMFLEVMDTNMMPGGGTNIAEAIKLAQNSFESDPGRDKVIIIFSDGEEHNLDELKEVKNIPDTKIYTVGVGTAKGSLVPEFDSQGKASGYKKDEKGNYVVSKINTATLEKLAKLGDGKFYLSSIGGTEIEKLREDIMHLKRDRLKGGRLRDYDKIYQYFLASGILLFVTGYLYKAR